MNLFKKPKYLLMILLASFTFVTFVPQFAGAQHVPYMPNEDVIKQAEQRTADAGGKVDPDSVTNWLATQLGHIVYFFTIKLPSLILLLEIKMFKLVGSYNGFTSQAQVKEAWVTVRDLANMFFILILLLMAFGTILQVQGFGYRQLLSKLLLMAILINFSKSIVALLIDFSQIVTLTFLAPVLENLAGNYIVALGLQNIMSLPQEGTGTFTGVTYLMAMILGGIMMIITTVIMGVILIMFVLRIVGFWILIILAPMAFLARAFPKTSSYYGQWEGELSKNLTTGPALAFFLWLAFSIVGQGNISSEFKAETDTTGDNAKASIIDDTADLNITVSKVADTANMLNFVIAITLLMAGLKFAASSGAAGASVAGKASGSLQKWGSRIGRGATIGAAAGVGALAWKGTSGEGGAKGFIGQTSGYAGKGLAVMGGAMGLGGMQRAGLGLKNKEDKRRQRKKDYFAKRLEGMDPDEKKKYLATYGKGILGKHELGAREAAGLSQKNELDRGIEMAGLDPRDMTPDQIEKVYGAGKRRVEDVDQAEVNKKMAARAKEMEADFERTGDKASLEKLRNRHASVATTDSVRQLVDEKDVTALARVNFAGASNEIIDLVLSQEAKALGEMVDKMDEKKRDAFMQVIQNRRSDTTLPALGGEIGDNNSAAGKAFVLQSRFANERTGMVNRAAGGPLPQLDNSVTAQYQAVRDLASMTGATPAQIQNANRARDNVQRAASGAQLARIGRDHKNYNTALYDDTTGVADDNQLTDIMRAPATVNADPTPAMAARPATLTTPAVSATPERSRLQILTDNQTVGGRVDQVLSRNQTTNLVREDAVDEYILAQRTLSRSDKQIAKQIPLYAHKVFPLDANFVAYIMGLGKSELSKLDLTELRRVKPLITDRAKSEMIDDIV